MVTYEFWNNIVLVTFLISETQYPKPQLKGEVCFGSWFRVPFHSQSAPVQAHALERPAKREAACITAARKQGEKARVERERQTLPGHSPH